MQIKHTIITILAFLLTYTGVSAYDVYVDDGATVNVYSNDTFDEQSLGARQEGFWTVSGSTAIKPSPDKNILLGSDKYINWGITSGSAGYGFRDNSGEMEFKDNGDSWSTFVGSSDDLTLANTQIYVGNASNTPIATSAITVLSSGNVGIGTTSPQFKLHVDGNAAVKGLQYDTTITEITHGEGFVHWNSDDGTLELGMPGGNVHYQFGQELLAPRAKAIGSNINNGQLVFVSGATGSVVEMSLAQADTCQNARGTIAMATENITQNQLGFYTAFGLVRGDATTILDTSAYAPGTQLYLASTTQGEYTGTRPDTPNCNVKVGKVIRQHATEGIIFVDIEQRSNNFRNIVGSNGYSLEDMWLDKKDPTGFENQTDSTITFNNSTRTFTITPVTSYDYYIKGEKYVINSATSTVIASSTGTNFIYYDSNGVLQASITPWSITDADKAFVATVYWSGASGAGGYLADERHGINMSASTHNYLHHTVGTRYDNGLTGTFTTPQNWAVTSGDIHDEDLEYLIGATSTTRMFYRFGGGNDFTWSDRQDSIILEVADVMQYDNSGVLTDVPNNQYTASWICATNDVETPILTIMGQRVDVNIANARLNNQFSSLDITSLPTEEIKLLYRVISSRSGTSEAVEEVTDFRTVSTLPASNFVATDHGALAGLADDDHTQYLLADGTRSAAILDVTATTTFNGVPILFPDTLGANGTVLAVDNQTGQLKWTAAGVGDITDVWDCSTGNCSLISMSAGDYLDASAGELILPTASATTTEGAINWDTANDNIEVYNGTGTSTFTYWDDPAMTIPATTTFPTWSASGTSTAPLKYMWDDLTFELIGCWMESGTADIDILDSTGSRCGFVSCSNATFATSTESCSFAKGATTSLEVGNATGNFRMLNFNVKEKTDAN